MEKQLNHLKTLDGLRAIATLGIFLYHARILRQGSFPVTLFFMISGFMMYYTKNGLEGYDSFFAWTRKYVLKKLKDFYPLHVLTFICAFLLNKTAPNFGSIKSAVINLLLLQSFSEKQWLSYNSLSWYLSVTIFLYILGYFLIRLVNKYVDKTGCLLLIVIAVILAVNLIYRVNGSISLYYIYANPFYRTLDFLLGMLIARLFLNNSGGKADIYIYWYAELFLAFCFIVQYIISLEVTANPGYYTVLFSAALYLFARGKGVLSRLLSSKILYKLSYYSFEFYMIHELVLKVMRILLQGLEMNYYLKLFVIAIPSLFIAVALAVICKKIMTVIRSRSLCHSAV